MAAWQNGSPWNSMEPMLGKHWGIIHPCCHPEDGPAPVDEEHMCLGTAFPHGIMARVVTTPVDDMSKNATEVWEHFSLFRSTLPNHQAFVYCCFFFSVGMEARTHDYRNAWNHTKNSEDPHEKVNSRKAQATRLYGDRWCRTSYFPQDFSTTSFCDVKDTSNLWWHPFFCALLLTQRRQDEPAACAAF